MQVELGQAREKRWEIASRRLRVAETAGTNRLKDTNGFTGITLTEPLKLFPVS
jgi:hypothetical protein